MPGRHSGLEITVMEGVVPKKEEQERPMRRRTKGTEDTLGMSVTETGTLASSQSFGQATKKATFLKRCAT